MPGVDDWLNDPLTVIRTHFSKNGFVHKEKGVQEHFSQKFMDKNSLSWVPSLNDTPLHELQANSLVKFRCMVQDMYDPEFYFGVYETVDKTSEQTCLRSGKYTDILNCPDNQEINMNSDKNKTMDRQTLYCVPIPGENPWVKEGYTNHNVPRATPSGSSQKCRIKRQRSEEGDTVTSSDPVPMESDVIPETSTEVKRSRSQGDASTSSSTNSSTTAPNLNFPLHGETGPACIVKIYDTDDDNSILVNDTYEFVGVLSIDPALAQFHEADSDIISHSIEEIKAHSPPPSLVPRLHVVWSQKLSHCNPSLPVCIQSTEGVTAAKQILNEVSSIRSHIMPILEQALFGDSLAAQYMLCHLISTVYSRQDVIAVGKFSLNIMGCPPKSEFPQLFYNLMKQLVTKSHLLPMTVDNLNTMKFSPRKDYTANRLVSGLLQLSDGTHLVLDETAMEPGQLNAEGVKNLAAVGNVIQWQKVEYDFNFHKQDFTSNIPVLILSEGKSLLQCESLVHLIPVQTESSLVERFSGIHQFLTPALLAKLRSFLDIVRLLPYSLPDAVRMVIEEDFVEMRRQDPSHMTIDDFHSLLVLARLLSLSHGQTELTREFWDKAKIMEAERKMRIPTQ